jgi:hypothetical protein
MTTTETTGLEKVGGDFSRFFASRVSRRSFLSRVGVGAVALTMGGTAGEALVERAHAHSSCNCGACSGTCGCNNSVTCANLTGSNVCPSGSCICGCWWVSYSGCASGFREWCDCCMGCGSCSCHSGAPSCCNHKFYSSRSTCSTGCNHIKCRRWRCISSTYTVTRC